MTKRPTAEYERRYRKLLRRKDVFTVDAPVYPGLHEEPTFMLSYARVGQRAGRPTLVILPGGPGLASVLPYAHIRSKAVAAGFEVIMVEHRGVGLSRRSASGDDLPVESMRVEYAARDVLVVLDDCGIERAWIHGTSYGGYLAQAVGIIAPECVSGMFLDSAMHSARYEEPIREYNRQLFFSGRQGPTEEIAAKMRHVLDSGIASDDEVTEVVPSVYELCGPRVLSLLLDRLASRRRMEWDFVRKQFNKELDDDLNPFFFDFGLAGAIWYRQLVPPIADGKPFDTSKMFAMRAGKFPGFEGEPYDLGKVVGSFDWPVVLFSGERDTRTPVFVTQEIADLLPRSLHVTFPNTAHDTLRFRTGAVLAIEAACARGGIREAEGVAATVVADGKRHPQTMVSGLLEAYLAAANRLERELSDHRIPRLVAVAMLSFVFILYVRRWLRRSSA
ncbi:MAG: alpha/beta fold hydrolase [Rubrobacter sp.]|nr:alpha/beta fold hydrolase [Rubrobacter sp.]MDQ3639534.1 alpha/beta hydrolase [Actinomycetota bacterium]